MCGGGSNSGGGGGGGGGNNNSGGSNSGGSKPKPSGGHPSAGTGNSNNGGSSGHPSAGTGNSNSGSQNWKSGGGNNNSGGSNSGSSNNNSGSSNSNSGNGNSGNKSGGGNNNGGSNNKKPETTTTPPPKTETTGSENSGGSSPPPPGHPEHNENASSPPPGHPEHNKAATPPNEEETSGGSESGSGETGGSEETSSGNTGGDDGSTHPLHQSGGGDDGESGTSKTENESSNEEKTYADEYYDPDPPKKTTYADEYYDPNPTEETGNNGKGDDEVGTPTKPKSPNKDIKDNITHIQKVTADGFEKRKGDLSHFGVTMHTEVSEDGVIQVSFDGMKVTSLSSIIQSFVSVLGFDIIGHDKFVNHLKGIIDDAKKKHDNVTVDFTGFSQGGHIAMDIAEEIATYSINDDKIKMGTVVAIDALGMHENDIKKFNDAAEKTGMKLVTITAPSVDNAVTISEVVFGALAYPNSENWTFKVTDPLIGHDGDDMFTKILQALENDNKDNILEYVGQDSAYNPGYIQPTEHTENTDDDNNVIHLISNGETTPKNAKVSTLAVAGTDKDDIIKVADQPEAGQVILFGLEGHDQLIGAGKSDILYGGDGDDILSGGGGADELIGGKGADTFLISKADYLASKATTTITDFTDGTDKLSFHDGISYDDVTVETIGTQSKIKVKGTDDIIALINHDFDTVISEDDFVPAPIL